jgi:hypothetical protein
VLENIFFSKDYGVSREKYVKLITEDLLNQIENININFFKKKYNLFSYFIFALREPKAQVIEQ